MFNWIKKILSKPKEEELACEVPEIPKETHILTIEVNGERYTTENKEEIGELLKIFSEHLNKT